MLYAVYYQDTNGHCRLVGGGVDLTEIEADTLIKTIAGRHTKPHKVDYEKLAYTAETRASVLASKGISL